MSAGAITFKDRALVCIKHDLPVIWVEPGEKKCDLLDWPNLATTDLGQIEIWNAENSDRNVGCVAIAKLGGYWFLDLDKPGVLERIETETGNKVPPTWMSRSREGRGHFGFKQTAKSIAMGNLTELTVRDGAFSCRVDNAYVVGPGSYRKDLNRTYELIRDVEPLEAPDWLIEWCLSQKVSSEKAETNRDENNLIPHGQIHPALVKEAGHLCKRGYSVEGREAALLLWAHENCAPPLDEEHIRQIARSTKEWKQGDPLAETVLVNGVPIGMAPAIASVVSTLREEDIDRSEVAGRPTFPEWVMQDTSLFKNLVQPAIKTSNKRAELIFMPAVVTMLNYLSTKIRVKGMDTSLSIFLGLIACKGTFKSSCVELGFKYFDYTSLTASFNSNMTNANGRQLIMSAGSPEGLALAMSTTNCRNAILYFDELRKAAAKIKIENSSYASDLLTVYEAGEWSNIIKSSKQSYNFAAHSYAVSWIWCTTFKNYYDCWPKIMGSNTDLIDRVFCLLGPEKISNEDQANLYTDPLEAMMEGAAETRGLIEKAMAQKVYDFEDYKLTQDMLRNELSGLSVVGEEDGGDSLDLSASRNFGLAIRLAVYFAVDSGEKYITPEHIEKATALVKYRCAAIRYLRPVESTSFLGQLQQQMLHILRTHKGQMPKREWKRLLSYHRYDTELWNRAESGLVKTGQIRFDDIRTPCEGLIHQGGRPSIVVSLLKRSN